VEAKVVIPLLIFRRFAPYGGVTNRCFVTIALLGVSSKAYVILGFPSVSRIASYAAAVDRIWSSMSTNCVTCSGLKRPSTPFGL
jgi:hypothetical protein